ncbi:MAG: hypothetical protein ACK50J_30955 [Planctomyces sp.]
MTAWLNGRLTEVGNRLTTRPKTTFRIGSSGGTEAVSVETRTSGGFRLAVFRIDFREGRGSLSQSSEVPALLPDIRIRDYEFRT